MKKLAKKRKNNDTLWHAFVININELRNEPRRIEDKAMQGRAEHIHAHEEGGANTACIRYTHTHTHSIPYTHIQ